MTATLNSVIAVLARTGTLGRTAQGYAMQESFPGWKLVTDAYPGTTASLSSRFTGFMLGRRLYTSTFFFFSLYVAIILLFGVFFWFDSGSITHAHADERSANFGDCVWLSMQTMSGVGYGALRPGTSHYTQFVCLSETFVGVLYAALFTAVIIAKFTTPQVLVPYEPTVHNMLVKTKPCENI